MKDIISIAMGELTTAFDNEVVKAVQKVGIDVDKEELVKALDLYHNLVRCGECKWLRYCETEEMELTLDCDHPDGGGIPRSEEWFCADGEREGV
jgi:hypothetical protein